MGWVGGGRVPKRGPVCVPHIGCDTAPHQVHAPAPTPPPRQTLCTCTCTCTCIISLSTARARAHTCTCTCTCIGLGTFSALLCAPHRAVTPSHHPTLPHTMYTIRQLTPCECDGVPGKQNDRLSTSKRYIIRSVAVIADHCRAPLYAVMVIPLMVDLSIVLSLQTRFV